MWMLVLSFHKIFWFQCRGMRLLTVHLQFCFKTREKIRNKWRYHRRIIVHISISVLLLPPNKWNNIFLGRLLIRTLVPRYESQFSTRRSIYWFCSEVKHKLTRNIEHINQDSFISCPHIFIFYVYNFVRFNVKRAYYSQTFRGVHKR